MCVHACVRGRVLVCGRRADVTQEFVGARAAYARAPYTRTRGMHFWLECRSGEEVNVICGRLVFWRPRGDGSCAPCELCVNS